MEREREFRIVPDGEKLIPGKRYYFDSWTSLSKEILDSQGEKSIWINHMYDKGEVKDINLVILEEYPPGKAPGKIRHSFYVEDDLIFTYVLDDEG